MTIAQNGLQSRTPTKAQVTKVISGKKQILSFKNIVGKTKAEHKSFEEKVAAANFPALLDIRIDSPKNKMIATFKLNATEEQINRFLAAVGYEGYQISK